MGTRTTIRALLVVLAVLLVLPREAHASAKLYDITIFLNELAPYQRGGRIVLPPTRPVVAPLPTMRPPPPPVTRVAAQPPRAAPVSAPRAGPSRLRGWYIDGDVSLALVSDADLNSPELNSLGLTGGLSADTGFGFDLAVGYKYGNNFRTDVEFAYRKNDLDKVSFGGFGLTVSEDVGGEVTSTALLLNGYYDVQIGQPLEPYIGLGLGLAEINVDSADLATNDSDIVIAYQIAAGFKYRITDQLSAKAGYKFLATADPTINGTEAEYMTHNVEFGLVYDF